MKSISPGKVRALQVCATPQGTFSILAADHRDSLRAIVAPEAPKSVTAKKLTDIKLAITKYAAPAASAILLDPVYGVGQSVVGAQLPGHIGLVCAIEEQGYLGDPSNRRTPILVGWSIEKASRLGANGIKLLLFYHPDAGAASEEQERLVKSIAADCRRHEVPFFLEPIIYSINADIPKGSPQFAPERRRIVIETARRLSAIGPDIMKVEFPIDVRHQLDQAVWVEACAELNEASQVPWSLLSAGEPFETFKQQLQIACQAGCSGFVAGRAIWQELVRLPVEEWASFLTETACQRLMELSEIGCEYGAPWYRRYSLPKVDEFWFQQY